MIVRLNMRTSSEPTGWNNFTISQAKSGVSTILDTELNVTGWSLSYNNDMTTNSFSGLTEYLPTAPTGDAATFIDQRTVMVQAHATNATGGTLTLNGLDDTKLYNFKVTGTTDISNRSLGLSFQNGDEQILPVSNNQSEILTFTEVQSIDGTIVANWRAAQGEWGFISAMEIEEVEGNNPAIALVTGEIRPSNTVTITAINFDPVPNAVTLTDSNDNTLTLPLTSIGNDQYTFTLPSLSEVSPTQFLLAGAGTLTAFVDLG